jgi:cytochrome c oxidase assembly factor CtaG
MNPLFDAFVRSWPYDPWLWAAIVLSAFVYTRGWRALNRHDAKRWDWTRLAAFLLGLATIFFALASPLESFAALLLQAHMAQHMLLLMVAPPLIWLGAPLLPMLRGLPKPIRTVWIAPVLRSALSREVFKQLTHPLVAWPLFVGVMWLWHTPRGYELALDDGVWHVVQHVCFLGTGLLFWYPVISPYPSRPQWSRWIVLPYLILADVQNTVLAAWLTFSARPLYAHYTEMPRIGRWSVLEDQQAAGVLMWVPGSIVFLVPVFWIGVKTLYGPKAAKPPKVSRPVVSLPVIAGCSSGCVASAAPRRTGDLLNFPLVGRFLKWPAARPVMQSILLVLAVLVILDGLFGPSVAPANLAGVAPWIHWRGLVVLGLLVGGNFFCMACPFTLPRKLAARFLPAGRSWPRWLRNKWLAVALVALFLWSYEAFSLWDSPWLTAWIAIAYFVAAFAVDAVFRGSSFCKYVCPIGQFNFVQSLVSPLEVTVREPAICAGCHTRECIRGSAAASGCGMGLFQPRKVGNLDCTFCLDCVHACPHDNVGIFATLAGGGPSRVAAFRSGIGRLSRRGDVAVLVILLVFGAFANAAGMIAPVVRWQDALSARWGELPPIVGISAFYALVLVAMPLLLITAAAALCRQLARLPDATTRVATRYAYALVPLGFGMWLAHYGFHLFTSYQTIVPVAQRMSLDFGLAMLGQPEWLRACCAAVAPWIVHFEILALDFGLLLSLYVAYRIAAAEFRSPGRTVAAFAPWGLLIVLLFAAGVWIVTEPMQMRGTLPLGG